MAKTIFKRIIVLFLIISMTFGNAAFVGKTYGASFIFDLLNQGNTSNETGHENINFSAYFENGDEHSLTAVRDVNAYDANLELELEVNDVGYLKDACIEIYGANNEDLNFEVSKTRKVIENVEKEEPQNESSEQHVELNTSPMSNDDTSGNQSEGTVEMISVNGSQTPLNSQVVLDLNELNKNNASEENSSQQEIELNENTEVQNENASTNDGSNDSSVDESQTIELQMNNDISEVLSGNE